MSETVFNPITKYECIVASGVAKNTMFMKEFINVVV